ncbi:MAG: winged helix-turn-helix transcriptional regulator [Nitrososphaerota archaeon]|nr:winged helix-turn-helix transcriptional regulator [Nitrososphaerota archaeon]MDG7024385.1 winged helix-turn-helix transcriptional regulator [Nitrososphaerota archaeon]
MANVTRKRNDVRGNTLRAYVYLLRSGPSELRDVQRSLGLSSPSLASYHLGRLVEAGYATQDPHGRYLVVQEATNEILDGYTKLGGLVVPQLFFLAILFTAVVGFFAVMALTLSAYVPLLAGASVAMVLAFWYEVVRVWRRLASWN